ncbi:non-heme chloroperoxidase [Geomicrobium halophilum]|uniref:Non-heme chloroperoxidase n=1 Tax=Geomicrobium halophilum TaxID=549000 RepID=A0A841PQY3_9BACL|nr:alpha/beta hydrolase [Geomicrobium halophilum]MBB6451200.1 non-heme chloroperoxidase [Geomicrobium halophilum]
MGYYVQSKDHVNIFVEDTGNGEPVILIHGWPLNHKMFEYQLNALTEKGYRCIVPDLRGFGRSGKPATGYGYDHMADDIYAIVRQLNLGDFHLAGFSMGGAIAIRYVTRYSGQGVKKLFLLGAAAPSFTRREGYPYGMTKEEVNDLIQSTYEDRPDMLADFGENMFATDVSDPFNEWFFHLGLEASGHGTIRAAEALRDEDLRSEFDNIQTKTYIFHGKQDEICPFDFARILHDGIAGSELIPFEKSGHGLFYDQREAFNKTFLQFLRDQ